MSTEFKIEKVESEHPNGMASYAGLAVVDGKEMPIQFAHDIARIRADEEYVLNARAQQRHNAEMRELCAREVLAMERIADALEKGR